MQASGAHAALRNVLVPHQHTDKQALITIMTFSSSAIDLPVIDGSEDEALGQRYLVPDEVLKPSVSFAKA